MYFVSLLKGVFYRCLLILLVSGIIEFFHILLILYLIALLIIERGVLKSPTIIWIYLSFQFC